MYILQDIFGEYIYICICESISGIVNPTRLSALNLGSTVVPRLVLSCRPLFPLEPLLAGVIAASRSAPHPSASSFIGNGGASGDEPPLDAATLDVVRR